MLLRNVCKRLTVKLKLGSRRADASLALSRFRSCYRNLVCGARHSAAGARGSCRCPLLTSSARAVATRGRSEARVVLCRASELARSGPTSALITISIIRSNPTGARLSGCSISGWPVAMGAGERGSPHFTCAVTGLVRLARCNDHERPNRWRWPPAYRCVV